jgi:hypothetical protein
MPSECSLPRKRASASIWPFRLKRADWECLVQPDREAKAKPGNPMSRRFATSASAATPVGK